MLTPLYQLAIEPHGAAARLLLPVWVDLADSFWRRLRGLLDETVLPPDRGLLLTPCNQIHTVGMGFSIDALYLDGQGVIVDMDEALPPGRLGRRRSGAWSTLELAAGTASRLALQKGHRLRFTPA
ncbi:DUF192 domain-containing protein [Heliobacterium gestii]|uniref:DUF192 domain-containing protein n=1 Tax=Heliomicrobium gestii TaxID=2699 RepID=A0A845L622_HELGE|nr:DUF192 domain-containing protein [Heliomicrobium gestii]MBM7865831.1 uncharacterized membrane protein (UPF0127 family) [Heliomicrobium gestii]MZP42072.1 DUF192 domain-containing protein [Heliomicrobium gestii]